MKTITYQEAEQMVLDWMSSKTSTPFVVAFTDSTCENCQDFEDLAVGEIENNGIEIFSVDIKSNILAFPPTYTPTTYWYFTKDAPPLMKKGIPPSKELLLDLIHKVLRVNSGESTVYDEFF